jgi:hypothetical protein
MQDQRSFRKAFIRFKKAFIELINSQTNSSEISIPLILIRSRNLLSEGRYVVQLYNQLLVIWKIACGSRAFAVSTCNMNTL